MNFKRLCFAGVMVALFIAASTAVFSAGITGTKHDLSISGPVPYNSETQVCIFCHTPHNAKAAPLAPLWNHGSTSATFTLYSSTTLNATMAQPAAASKACLSCHDGTVAIDTYGTRTGSAMIPSTGSLDTDLSNDHPVSFTYDAALAGADGGLVTPASASLVVLNVPLFGAKLECASCHSVHDSTNGNFLRVSNSGSALCLKCHNK